MQGFKWKYSWWVLPLLALLISCGRAKLDSKEYQAFVKNPENGLRKDQNVGDFQLSALYESPDYILAKEFDTGADEQAMESRRAELEQFEHFQFRIKLEQGGNILRYDEDYDHNQNSRINYLSFEVKKDFSLINETDTIPCKLAHYSRNYNLTPTVDLSLAFDPIDKDKDFTLVYKDTQFDIGKVKFRFDQRDFGNLPELALNK